DGLPTPDPAGAATYPIVGSPTVVADNVDGKVVTTGFLLDASGRMDYFQRDVDDFPWKTAGPIRGGCFGAPGVLGDGSPRAVSFMGNDGVRHREVFVVGLGDLF